MLTIFKFCNNKVDIIAPFYTWRNWGSERYPVPYTPQNILSMCITIHRNRTGGRQHSVCLFTAISPMLSTSKCSMNDAEWLDEKQSWSPVRGGECFQGNMRFGMSPGLQGSAGWYRPILVLHSSCQSPKGAVTCSWPMKLQGKLTQDWFCLLTLAWEADPPGATAAILFPGGWQSRAWARPWDSAILWPSDLSSTELPPDNGRVLSRYLLAEFSVPADRGVLMRECVWGGKQAMSGRTSSLFF